MDQAGGVRARGEGGGGRPDERDGIVRPGRHRRPTRARRPAPSPARRPRRMAMARVRAPPAARRGSRAWRCSSACRPAAARTPAAASIARRGPASRPARRPMSARWSGVRPRLRNRPSTQRSSTHGRASGTPACVPATTSAPSRAVTGAGTRTDVSLASAASQAISEPMVVRGVQVRPADAEHVSDPAGIDPVRHVLLVAEQRQTTVLQVARVRRQRLATEPSDPPQLAATAQQFVRTHRPSVAPRSSSRGSEPRTADQPAIGVCRSAVPDARWSRGPERSAPKGA